MGSIHTNSFSCTYFIQSVDGWSWLSEWCLQEPSLLFVIKEPLNALLRCSWKECSESLNGSQQLIILSIPHLSWFLHFLLCIWPLYSHLRPDFVSDSQFQLHISTCLLLSPSFSLNTVNEIGQLSALIQFICWLRSRFYIYIYIFSKQPVN